MNYMTENEIGTQIVRAAIEVHRELGPGLLESVYERALAHELECSGLQVDAQVPVAVTYKSVHFDVGFRLDLFVNRMVVIELKSVEHVLPVHRKQLQTYLRLSKARLGYLLNFGSALMKDGIVRAVNGLPE
jgi:GxxExxY protein